MREIINDLAWVLGLFTTFYTVPFLIRKGWGDARNKTVRVCDVCFRDIEMWNNKIKKNLPNSK